MSECAARPVELLVPVADVDHMPAGLRHARDLSARARAEVAVLHVVDPLANERPDHALQLMADRHRALAQQVRGLGIDADTLVQQRPVGTTVHEHILEVAEERDSDVIVVTSRRVTGTIGALTGSTARSLLRSARRPVLVVHP